MRTRSLKVATIQPSLSLGSSIPVSFEKGFNSSFNYQFSCKNQIGAMSVRKWKKCFEPLLIATDDPLVLITAFQGTLTVAGTERIVDQLSEGAALLIGL